MKLCWPPYAVWRHQRESRTSNPAHLAAASTCCCIFTLCLWDPYRDTEEEDEDEYARKADKKAFHKEQIKIAAHDGKYTKGINIVQVLEDKNKDKAAARIMGYSSNDDNDDDKSEVSDASELGARAVSSRRVARARKKTVRKKKQRSPHNTNVEQQQEPEHVVVSVEQLQRDMAAAQRELKEAEEAEMIARLLGQRVRVDQTLGQTKMPCC